MRKRVAAWGIFVLTITLLLNLTACSAGDREEDTATALPQSTPIDAGTGNVSAEPQTVSGYISTEFDNPAWLDSWGGCEIIGDTFYIVAHTKEGGFAAARFDTVEEQWDRYELEIGPSNYPGVERFSATESSLWLLLRERVTQEEEENHDYSRERGYYLLHVDLNSGTQTWSSVDFWREGNPYLMSLIALDSGRALVGNGETTYLIDFQAQVLDTPQVNIQGEGLHARIGGDIYVSTENGLAKLDTASVQFENPIEEISDQSVYCSSLGHFLTTKDNVLYSVDPESGEETELFPWINVALSYNRLYGWQGLENSKGDIFHFTDRITKISKAQVPLKKTLTLACMGDASDETYVNSNYSYTCAQALMEAIIRFNNSDPEFRIEIKPFIYHNDAERDKVLIELASGKGIDLIDTSLLPAGSVDRQFLVDMLPYLDADESISRDDFIPSLLNSMMKNGGLYEYVNKYTMLTMVTHPEFADGGKWTVEEIQGLLTQYPDMMIPANQELLVTLFSWAATGEFMDWTDMSCNFDSPDFLEWLALLKTLYSKAAEQGSNTYLFNITHDFARQVGFGSRRAMMGEYVPVGFPNSRGTGSYFMKLGTSGAVSSTGRLSDNLSTLGSVTSLGILASSEHPEGAWRFVRTFILGEEEPALSKGIPVLKESFESAVDIQLRRAQEEERDFEVFNESDAECLRELVYNTNMVVCADDPVMDTLKAALNAYLGGKGSGEETAEQLQSRLSLYMAEQA